MITGKAKDCLDVVGGKLLQGSADKVFRGVSINSRTVEEEELFVCIQGEKFDGHNFLGEAIKKAAGNRKGITRYASTMIPMDETLSRVSIDVSNRPYLIWKVNLPVEKLGEMDTELFKEWFQAFSQSAGITMHVENIYGDNSHHIIESCYKALARSLREALEMDPRSKKSIPSTKGSL